MAFAFVISTSESHAARHTSRRLSDMAEAFPFSFGLPGAFGITRGAGAGGSRSAAPSGQPAPGGNSAPSHPGAGRSFSHQTNEVSHG